MTIVTCPSQTIAATDAVDKAVGKGKASARSNVILPPTPTCTTNAELTISPTH